MPCVSVCTIYKANNGVAIQKKKRQKKSKGKRQKKPVTRKKNGSAIVASPHAIAIKESKTRIRSPMDLASDCMVSVVAHHSLNSCLIFSNMEWAFSAISGSDGYKIPTKSKMSKIHSSFTVVFQVAGKLLDKT